MGKVFLVFIVTYIVGGFLAFQVAPSKLGRPLTEYEWHLSTWLIFAVAFNYMNIFLRGKQPTSMKDEAEWYDKNVRPKWERGEYD